MSAKGHGLLADVFEFTEAWQPGGDESLAVTADDIRERIQRAVGLVQAAVLTEYMARVF